MVLKNALSPRVKHQEFVALYFSKQSRFFLKVNFH